MTPDPAAGGDQADVDVLIVGAGLSGIGMACHLRRELPGTSFAILEARSTIGGTWDLFRYPGIRSDSDMYTLGYNFRPWRGARSIADGPSILAYIRDTAAEYDVTSHVRFNERAVAAAWSSEAACWTVTTEGTTPAADGDATAARAHGTITARFLFMSTGYYRYDAGYSPDFPGRDRFSGPVVHPQHWPEGLDVAGNEVVVIGSGATAVTLVPALANQGAHVTMVQRTPTYVAALPSRDRVADALRRRLPEDRAYAAIRRKNITTSALNYQLSRKAPKVMKALLRYGARKALPADYDVDTHFAPPYNPWDQRLCLAPDGDLFATITAGRAEVVTDRIATFTEVGVQLASGRQVPADVIVTATGLNLLVLGGLRITVDDVAVQAADTVGYKGAMFSGVPNLAVALGYTNASWTLKCDLVSEYVCRLLAFMAERGYREVMPLRPPAGLPTRPFIDFGAGYIQRSLADLPRQVDVDPWRLHQNYFRDRKLFVTDPLQDDGIRFR